MKSRNEGMRRSWKERTSDRIYYDWAKMVTNLHRYQFLACDIWDMKLKRVKCDEGWPSLKKQRGWDLVKVVIKQNKTKQKTGWIVQIHFFLTLCFCFSFVSCELFCFAFRLLLGWLWWGFSIISCERKTFYEENLRIFVLDGIDDKVLEIFRNSRRKFDLIDKTLAWRAILKLELSTAKTQMLLFKRRLDPGRAPPIYIHGQRMGSVQTFKCLDVLMEERLGVITYAAHTCERVR